MSPRRGNRALRLALATTSLVLPAATLVPLGSMWLWEHGFLLQWAGGALVLALLILAVEWWLFRPGEVLTPAIGGQEVGAASSTREAAAWQAVQSYAESLTPESVRGENAIQDLALQTVNVVAREIHPGEVNPIWNFTVPEALALAERVAARLRPVVIDNMPLGDQLTVRQVLKLYEWRVAVDWAERAYDIWRIVRLINPAAAITHEARERLTKKVYMNLRDEFTVRVGQGYVREVGRAAIDLYGGRLRALPDQPEDQASSASSTPPAPQSGFKWGRLARQAKNLGSAGASWVWKRRS